MEDDIFLTPQLRTGPSSRLLKRRSQAPPPAPMPATAAEVTNFAAENMDVTSFANLTRFQGGHNVTSNVTRVALSDSMFTQNLSMAQQGIVEPESELIDAFLAAVCNDAAEFQVLDQIAELEEILSLNIPNKPSVSTLMYVSALKQERDTWRLVGRLYHDQLMQAQNLNTSNVLLDNALASEKEIIEHAFTTDRKLRRVQVVVDWLEYNSRKDLEKHHLPIPPQAITGNENTLATLLGRLNYRSSDMVSQLDPDAPARENKALHDLDVRDEAELAKLLFIYVRSGMLELAQEVCEASGHPWRAGTLDGWKLFHDPNLSSNVSSGTSEIKPTEGNLNRDIWKRVALRMTQDVNLNRYFRAAYSALCGNVSVLKSVCSTWEDLLWAYAKCLVDINVEMRIREVIARPLCDLPNYYWENKTNIEAVFDSVDAINLNEEGIKDAKIFHQVQKLLILNDIPRLLDVIDDWSKSAAGSSDLVEHCEILRFFAHLVLMLKRLDQLSSDRGLECVARYCQYLMNTNHVQQVAWYVAQLRHNVQVELYSTFLARLIHEADKRLALALAVENGLPIQDILSEVVRKIHEDESDADEEIPRKINALEWLLYDPKQVDEALERGNLLIRKLKATGKDEFAVQTFEKIPSNATQTLLQNFEETDLPRKQDLIMKEYLSWSAYFAATSGFDRWWQHYNKEKPKMPSKANESQHLTKQVTLEKQAKQYNINLEQWKVTQESLAKEAHDKLMVVLTFSDGWLGQPEDDQALNYLRKLCIPQVILLLHTILHTTEQFREAMALADLVADETYGLYECFHKENMRTFLSKIKQSAVCKLENQ